MKKDVKPNRNHAETGRGTRRRTHRILLGVGLDGDGEEKRITVGKNFQLFGGSKGTHERMQEKAIKINEHLTERGKTLDQVEREEFDEIANEIGLVRLPRGD